MRFLIEPDKVAYDSILKRVENAGKDTKEVMKRAINETAAEAKNNLHSETKKTYTIKASQFKKSDIKKKSATAGRLAATLSAKGATVGIRAGYKNRINGKKKAAQAMIRKDGAMKELELSSGGKTYKAFVARMKTGHEGIFQRVPGSKMKSGHGEKIKELVSISKSKAMEQVYKNGMEREIQEDLSFRMLKHMNAVIGEK